MQVKKKFLRQIILQVQNHEELLDIKANDLKVQEL